MQASVFIAACLLFVAVSVSTAADTKRKIEKRSAVDDDIEALLLESLQTEYNRDHKKEQKAYGVREDVFEERRWRPVYADSNEFSSRVMNSITSDLATTIVNLHNELRNGEGSSNMERLRYNNKLADLAHTWSQRCVFEHGQPGFDANSVGWQTLGQNIYAHESASFKVEDAVNGWFGEKPDYDYNSASCHSGKVCGHYTAVTWAQTTDVGCGITHCPSISGLKNAHFIVCNYGPAGNFQGQKPFLKGPSCTQCDSGKFYCNNGLCDSSCTSAGASCQCKAACQHCGKSNPDCTCTCIAGYTGPDCSAACADLDPKCGANPGYPDMLCNFNDPNWAFVKNVCPKMCKKCQPSDGTPCNHREDEANYYDKKSALKRLMLSYLEKELKQDNARSGEK